MNWRDVLSMVGEGSSELLGRTVKDAKIDGREIFAHVIYEQVYDESSGAAGQIPFVLSQLTDVRRELERGVVGTELPVSFSADFFELGKWGSVYGEISSKKVHFAKRYNERSDDVIYDGEKRGDVYEGEWRFGEGREELTGRFKMMLDIEAPL